MSEKRPDSGLDEEMKRKLKVNGSASGSGDHQETLKLKSALKPERGKRNQDKGTKKRVTFDLPAASGSVSNQETSKAPVGKRSQDKEVKRKERFGRSASGSVAKQERLKPERNQASITKDGDFWKKRRRKQYDVAWEAKKPKKLGKSQLGIINNVDRENSRAVDDVRLKAMAQMWERSRSKSRSRSRISSSSSSKSKDKAPTLVCNKTLTHEDLLTGTLRVPAARFLDKKREGKHDRMMVPFRDNKGVVWEMEATPQGLSLNWDKFVEAHGLRYKDEIFFYDDDPKSKHFTIEYTRSGSEVQSGSK